MSESKVFVGLTVCVGGICITDGTEHTITMDDGSDGAIPQEKLGTAALQAILQSGYSLASLVKLRVKHLQDPGKVEAAIRKINAATAEAEESK